MPLKGANLYGAESLNRELTLDELADILSTTIKEDRTNKLVGFVAWLCTYTYDSQINIGFTASSSTGKTYISLELAAYFPEEDVLVRGYTSPTAFFHEAGKWHNEKQAHIVDLERKILVFVDEPHFQLLARLRPILSHDRKEVVVKITDRGKSGLKTKTVIIRGFSTFVFCTTFASPDEQEQTRLLLLSPETTSKKLYQSVKLTTFHKSAQKKYDEQVLSDPRRKWLRERILGLKKANISDVLIESHEAIAERFINQHGGKLTPRNQRDIVRLIALVKGHALLNFRQREQREGSIVASDKDVEAGFQLYNQIAEANEKGLTPEANTIFKEVVQSLWSGSKEVGVSFQQIQQKYYELNGVVLNQDKYRKVLLPSWIAAGLVQEKEDPYDKRKQLLHPPSTQVSSSISVPPITPPNNIGGDLYDPPSEMERPCTECGKTIYLYDPGWEDSRHPDCDYIEDLMD